MSVQLDLQQCAAVKSQHQNIMVIAGAGSGKTRVLTERIAHLIENCKVSPTEIVALTFTRKAAGEMAHRLEKRIGPRDAHRLRIGTIHAMALRYIRMWGDALGIRPGTVTVYGEWEATFLLRDTAKLVKAPAGYADAMEAYYQTGIEPEQESPHRRLFDVFTSRLRQNNALNYGMLLVGMVRILPEICSRPLSHLLVDEAQDLDAMQWGIIRTIQGLRPSCSLFVVGDVGQSIYSFRGAIPEMMIKMQSKFNVFKLENNYRSATVIVASANKLIEHNTMRIPLVMHPHREDPGRLRISRDMDSAAVAQMLQAMLAEHPNIAVLSRIHVLLFKLSQDLDALGVKHSYCAGKSKVMQAEPFRRLHALLKLVLNHFDNFSFALARPLLGISDEEYLAVLRDTSESGRSNLSAWIHLSDKAYAWANIFAKGAFEDLGGLITDIEANLPPDDADVQIICRIVREFAQNGGKLKDFLDWVATRDLQEDVRDDGNEGLQLMTVHQAKGLEFPVVVVVGMNEGVMPSKQAIDGDEIEEERRIAYVAITRAEDHLVIAVRPEATESKGKAYINQASRFVQEMTL